MHVVFMGPPGSGKGTQSMRIAAHLSAPHLSTGDMLREAKQQGTELGKEAARFMDQGHLVPDDLVVGVLIARILEDDCAKGVLLDGFPRTIGQAIALDKHLEQDPQRHVDVVLELEVPEDELISRLTGRAKTDKRIDDTPQTVQRRLEIYQNQTTPLRGYYSKQGRLATIDGMGTPDEVFERILAAITERGH